ncbi:MAG: site-specific integrase [Planctomycetota bacterium]
MRRRRKIPSLRHHRASGRGVVTLGGTDIYCGTFGTQVCQDEYDRVVTEWLANGRRLPTEYAPVMGLTVTEVLLRYWDHADEYYRKDGQPSPEWFHLKGALKLVRRLYGPRPVESFGPLSLKACQLAFLEAGQARKTINQNVGRIKRVLKWAVAEELAPPEVYHGLLTVDGLRRGRSRAKETQPVRPAPEEAVEAVLPHVSGAVQALIRLQLLTGMRPGEVVIMRGQDIDRSEETWLYHPSRHKTQHHGHERPIYIGPQAQEVIRPFLETAGDGYLFSPRAAEEARNARRKLARKTPMTPSQRARKRKASRKRAWREHYDVNSYRRAIHRGCEKAGVDRWNPHQLRHNAATRLRKEFGIEATRAILGHRSSAVTEIYAELDQTVARDAMAKAG